MKALAAIFTVAAFLFVAPIIGVLFGAFAGWVVGLFFAETVLGFLARTGFDVAGFSMWQVGAAMGFLGSFVRASAAGASRS